MGRWVLVAAVLALSLVIACSGSASPPSAGGGTTSAPSSAKSSPVAGQPQRGGKLWRLFDDPPTLDPHLTTDTTSAGIIVEVFGGLVTIDPQIKVVPDLAQGWQVSQDGRVYTFQIRRDAKFHDGRPVTAEDLRWSLERATDPRTQSTVADQYLGDIVGAKEKLSGKAQSLSGLKVVDDRTLSLTIDAPKAYFLAKLTYPTAFVLDRKNVEGRPKDWFRQPNGTGPFKLASYEVGRTLKLTRNEHYHLGPPLLDEVEFILSGGQPMLMYENNEIHLTGVGLADLDAVLQPRHPLNKELRKAQSDFSVSYIGLNVTRPPLDDLNVRQALNLAVDKKTIATTALADLVVPAKGVIPPGFPSYTPLLRGYDYDPARAKQLLKQSRYGASLDKLPPITLSIAGSFGTEIGLDMEAVLQMWEKNLGIRVDIQQTEWATFLQDLHRHRFQMFETGWVADYPDPENFLDILFHSKSNNNHSGYRNPEVDSLLERARVEADQTSRYELYNRIEQLVVDDAPWIPLWHSRERYVLVKPTVQDYFLAPLVIPKLRYVYLTK